MDGNATVEYSSTYLYYSLFLLDDNVELKVTEDGVSLYLNNELVGEKTLSDNILLFEKALSDITQILSYPDNFKVTEIKKYYGFLMHILVIFRGHTSLKSPKSFLLRLDIL